MMKYERDSCFGILINLEDLHEKMLKISLLFIIPRPSFIIVKLNCEFYVKFYKVFR